MKQKVKNTIPVYDICSIGNAAHLHEEVIAEPFDAYQKARPNLHFPHRHSFYHIVFFTAGSGTHTIDFEQFEVTLGQIYFMRPGQVHGWNFNGDVDGFVINFTENLFRAFLADAQYLEQFTFLRGVAKDSVWLLEGETREKVEDFIRLMIATLEERHPFGNDLVRACLLCILNTVAGITAGTNTSPLLQQNQVVLHNFRKLVEQYYAEKRLPKEYAAMLYITPNHLNALCKDLLNQPAGEIIRDRVLLEAKRLLVNAALDVSEIAYQLNFTDNSYFSKFFKKYTGTTPENFRKMALNKTQ